MSDYHVLESRTISPRLLTYFNLCSHIFCESCIYQALESAPQCPVDRSPLSLSDLQTAVKIIHNMVNELVAHCPRSSFGCTYVGQRHLIIHHLNSECEYTPLPCEMEECSELVLKRDMNSHVETCQYRMSECLMCKKKMRAFELEVGKTLIMFILLLIG